MNLLQWRPQAVQINTHLQDTKDTLEADAGLDAESPSSFGIFLQIRRENRSPPALHEEPAVVSACFTGPEFALTTRPCSITQGWKFALPNEEWHRDTEHTLLHSCGSQYVPLFKRCVKHTGEKAYWRQEGRCPGQHLSVCLSRL